MGPLLFQVGTPLSLSFLPPLLQSDDVNAYQTAAQNFVSTLTSSPEVLPYGVRQAFLGDVMTQPRAVTSRLLSRTQDEKGLLQAGQENLPLLIVSAKEDKQVIVAYTIKAVEGWKALKIVEIENSGHMLWLEQPDVFRRVMLEWIGKITGKEA